LLVEFIVLLLYIWRSRCLTQSTGFRRIRPKKRTEASTNVVTSKRFQN